MTRRDFVAGLAVWPAAARDAALRFGVLTDVHYADRDTAGTRCYRESLAKASRAAAAFTEAHVSDVFELGDLIDSGPTVAVERGYLERISTILKSPAFETHFVPGNHCVSALSKPEFLRVSGAKAAPYSLDRAGIHLVVLDSCFAADGRPYGGWSFDWKEARIPDSELGWLERDLERAKFPAIVFLHHCLDVDTVYAIRNAPEVRALLERSRKVRAVFQGHTHTDSLRTLNGIHYRTFRSMVDGCGSGSGAYGIVEVSADGAISIRGFQGMTSEVLPIPAR